VGVSLLVCFVFFLGRAGGGVFRVCFWCTVSCVLSSSWGGGGGGAGGGFGVVVFSAACVFVFCFAVAAGRGLACFCFGLVCWAFLCLWFLLGVVGFVFSWGVGGGGGFFCFFFFFVLFFGLAAAL